MTDTVLRLREKLLRMSEMEQHGSHSFCLIKCALNGLEDTFDTLLALEKRKSREAA